MDTEHRPVDLIFPGRREAIEADLCRFCNAPAKTFRDALSRREYSQSGMCQRCQDDFFGS